MNDDYFPKTNLEYEYYFEIEKIKKAIVHNEKRKEILKMLKSYQPQTEIEDLLLKCTDLKLVLEKIENKDKINSIVDFYGIYNTALLIDASIQVKTETKKFISSCKKTVGNREYKKTKQELRSVGFLITPQSTIMTALRNHFSGLVMGSFIFVMLYLAISQLASNKSDFEKIVYFMLYVAISMIGVLKSEKFVDFSAKSRLNKVKYQFSYHHKYQNKDFVSESVKNKINRI